MSKEGLMHDLPKEYDATATQEILEDMKNKVVENSGVPVGTILSFAGSTSPAGYLLCDGSAIKRTSYKDLFSIIGTTYGTGDGSTTFNIPDLRGIFVRGAGTSGKLSNANGVAFSGTLGTYQNDKSQGHVHYITNGVPRLAFDGSSVGTIYNTTSPNAIGHNLQNETTAVPRTDGTNGTPRTGTETNPANLGLNYIIKT